MPLPLMGIGAVMSGGAGLMGAFGANSAAKRAEKQSQKRYQDLYNLVTGNMQNTPGQGESALFDFAKMSGANGPAAISGEGYDASMIDMEGLFPDGTNMGNDAIMQMIRANPEGASSRAMGRLESIADMNPNDFSGFFDGFNASDNAMTEDQVLGLNRGVKGLGQRGGTARATSEALLRSRIAGDIGARNAGIAQNVYGINQNSRLNALTQIAGIEDAASGRTLQGADILNRSAMDRAGLMYQGRAANAGAANTAGQFNADLGFRAASTNAANQSQNSLMILQALSQAASAEQGRRNTNSGLLSTLGGLPQPGTAGGSATPGALGDIGNLLMLLPSLRELSKPTNKAA